MGVFSKVFKAKEGKKVDLNRKDLPQIPQKPTWTDAWTRTIIQPEEVHDLLRACTTELKARGLDVPFLLLPFRPASDLSATRTFVKNYFGADSLQSDPLRGEELAQELKLTEPLVIAGVLKWCWSRLPGGVVTWEAYELFKIGEHDSGLAPNAFNTFIPISVGSGARSKIIFDFFDLFSAVAAHGKINGFGGRQLSRYAAWWAFEFNDSGNGFDGGYKTWTQAADATSHLFFAYLRSLAPTSTQSKSILGLPRALQQLLDTTEYPPVLPANFQSRTSKVVMIVDSVSPTPFALLRRANNFHYREGDTALRNFSAFDDPVAALTNECKRVLKSISSANESTTAKHSTSLREASWSRFEDIGFEGVSSDFETADDPEDSTLRKRGPQFGDLRSQASSKVNDVGRPTTPSWADFMSAGFQEQIPNGNPSVLLPPDKILPAISTRTHTSQSVHNDNASALEPGELASISSFDLDETFWWVWMTSLAGEEPSERKAAFGRCALVETKFGNQWIVMEEIIKGAAPEPDDNAYIAEKKSRFGFSTRRKLSRSKSSARGTLQKPESTLNRTKAAVPMSSKTNIAPDQHARIQAAAAALQERNRSQSEEAPVSPRRARHGDDMSTKTSSVLTLQPLIMSEAGPALQWANRYDKGAIRAKYLGDSFAGRGSNVSLLNNPPDNQPQSPEASANGSAPSARLNSADKDKENRQPVGRSISPEPRDEAAKIPAGNPTLLEVLQKGPPGSKPYQAPTLQRKTVPNSSQSPVSAPPQVPPKGTSGSISKAIVDETHTSGTDVISPQSTTVTHTSEQVNPSMPSQTLSSPEVPVPVQTAEHDSVPAAEEVPVVSQSSAVPQDVSAETGVVANQGHPTYHETQQANAAFAAPIESKQTIQDRAGGQLPQAPIQVPRSTPAQPSNQTSVPAQNTPSVRAPIASQPPPASNDVRPVSPETSRSKLQKKAGQNSGFKSIFSRKKKEEPMRNIAPRKPTPNSSSVAAARAALEAKAAEAQKAPEPTNRVTSKRFSTVSRKTEPDTIPVADPVPNVIEPEVKEDRPAPLPKDTPVDTPADTPKDTPKETPKDTPIGTTVNSHRDSQMSQSMTEEEKRAEHEFRSFDQGPLHDAPAFTPADTPSISTASNTRKGSTQPEEHDVSPLGETPPPSVAAPVAPEETEPEVSPNDRWAQIRKNAAERAALTKQPSGQSGQTTDDGETSGEETIETRVARIKARVAELTGNMDLPANRR